ncbi:MAG: hypothetical protein JO034_04515, partial [Singulisphaera sp.]|nr:hypothetical protein [Singulisphaera sp.]
MLHFYELASLTFEGRVPYRDYTIEFPIAGFAIMLLPRLLQADFQGYFLAFVAEILIVNTAGMYLVGRTIDQQAGLKGAIRGIAWYALFFLVLSPLAV